jgi:trigger factor
MQIKITKLPKSEVEIEGELEADIFETYFPKALKKIGETIKLDGFRPGKIPESVLLSNVPEMQILEEMAEMALNENYPKIIADEKIDAISRPEISIVKLARNNPLGFKIKTAVLPEMKLPDYKKIGKEIISKITDEEKNIVVTDEDLENTITDIRKSRAPKIHMADTTPPDLPLSGEEKEKMPEPELPEFNDEFVRALGPFKDVADFKNKLKENIKLEKENQAKEKTRIKIIEKIIEDSVIEVPEILIDVELDKILYKMESDITQMGLKFEDYLKHINKTVPDLRKEFRGDAEKKAKLALILNEIAKTEKIIADPEQVAREVAAILEHYKDADPERAQMHAENVLTNEKIFQFLETQ